VLRPFLDHRPADAALVDRLVPHLHAGLEALEGAGLDRGFCHGDAHGGNAHRADDGTVTFFDFDCCGVGWRAHDAAVFRWQQEWHARAETHWAAFLDGYRSVRLFSAADDDATPLLVAVRELWLLGVHARHGSNRGFGWNALNDDYLDRRFEFLRRWAHERLGVA
jgi:Ser/Thr protein kinase RdoA (MazF antagonist)